MTTPSKRSPSSYHSNCINTASVPSFLLIGNSQDCSSSRRRQLKNHDGNEENQGGENETHIAFSDLDPTIGNDEAAEMLIQLETGIVARNVTERLTVKDSELRAKRLQELKSRLAYKKKIPVRSQEEVGEYIKAMIAKGEQKKKMRMVKVEQEMYPEQIPRISKKSHELAQSYRERQEKKKIIQERLLQRNLKKLENKQHRAQSSSDSPPRMNLYQHDDLDTTEIIQKRHDGHSFRPAGSIQRSHDLFLSTATTTRTQSPNPNQQHRSSEEERKQRFIELSQPREHQKSKKRIY